VASELVTFHQPDHPVSRQYEALFSQLSIEATDDCPTAALLFTALAAGAGTTTSVLNLAIAGCSRHKKKMVVVDADLARPAVAGRLGAARGPGLQDVLRGKVGLEQAVHTTPIRNLFVLPAGNPCDDEATSPDAFRWVVAWLRQRFDLVLVDAPAWVEGNDLRTMLPPQPRCISSLTPPRRNARKFAR
jgi:Mrp family chromosome partitioning ATPase